MSQALYQLSYRNNDTEEVEILKTKPQTLDQYWSTLVILILSFPFNLFIVLKDSQII